MEYKEISPQKANDLINDKLASVIDIRCLSKINSGVIHSSIHVDRIELEPYVENNIRDRTENIVIVCEQGDLSKYAVNSLISLGYENVYSLKGGINRWIKECLPTEKLPDHLKDFRKFSKQIKLPEVGIQGQKKLFEARVLIIGVGGLGTPCAQYLTLAGVGNITLIDNDQIELSNLNRQVLFNETMIGKNKATAASFVLNSYNNNRTIDIVSQFEEDDFEKFSDYDVVVDCTDNFNSRSLINKFSIRYDIPLVQGSVHSNLGQVLVANTTGTAPCYRCIYPEFGVNEIRSCNEVGVMGVVTGIIGLLQANEIIKLILGVNNSSLLLEFDSMSGEVTKYSIRKRKDCLFCGEYYEENK
ncbi:ThiF family adenylyltransferase [Vibrio cholerae]|nr:ThiF family adenylyltransferase [Vibrio cholerae]EJY4340681.1 ThiF family adenylyltransferase [Vibrio cholerae]